MPSQPFTAATTLRREERPLALSEAPPQQLSLFNNDLTMQRCEHCDVTGSGAPVKGSGSYPPIRSPAE